MNYSYEEIRKITKQEALHKISSNNIEEIKQAILSSCLYGDDYEFALDLCIRFFNHPDIRIRESCAWSVSYICVNFHKLDINFANYVTEYSFKSSDSIVCDTIDIIKDDIYHYIKGFKFLKAKGLLPLKIMTTAQIIQNVNSNENYKIMSVIASAAVYGNDYNLSLNICEEFTKHKEQDIRILCLYSLIYICFFNFNKLHCGTANTIFNLGINDPKKSVRKVAIEVINHFKTYAPGFKFTEIDLL